MIRLSAPWTATPKSPSRNTLSTATEAAMDLVISTVFTPARTGPTRKHAIASSAKKPAGVLSKGAPLNRMSDCSASSSASRAEGSSISERNEMRRDRVCSAFSGGSAQGWAPETEAVEMPSLSFAITPMRSMSSSSCHSPPSTRHWAVSSSSALSSAGMISSGGGRKRSEAGSITGDKSSAMRMP